MGSEWISGIAFIAIWVKAQPETVLGSWPIGGRFCAIGRFAIGLEQISGDMQFTCN